MKNIKAHDNFETHWTFLQLSDGSIDVDQLKLELLDFSEMIDEMSKLASFASGGVMSYPTYPAESILCEFQDRVKEAYDNGYSDACDDNEE